MRISLPCHGQEGQGKGADFWGDFLPLGTTGMCGDTMVLGSQVNKPSQILMKTSNVMEYIESYIQNIEAPRTYDPIV